MFSGAAPRKPNPALRGVLVMALSSSNVRVAVTGAVYLGASGTAAPTSHASSLNAAFKDLGYISEDGVTETRDRSSNTIKGWQNADIVREVVTESSLTYHFTMIETNAFTVAAYYGTTIDTTDGEVVIVPANTGGRKAFVIDAIDGAAIVRTYIRDGEIVEVGDLVYVSGDPIGYEVTVRAYPNSTDAGSAVKWYSSLIV